MYMDKVPLRDELEFTKMRYTAITCDPNDFVVSVAFAKVCGSQAHRQDDRYTLRQKLYDPPRQTELFIVSYACAPMP
jgi:chitin synthase